MFGSFHILHYINVYRLSINDIVLFSFVIFSPFENILFRNFEDLRFSSCNIYIHTFVILRKFVIFTYILTTQLTSKWYSSLFSAKFTKSHDE